MDESVTQNVEGGAEALQNQGNQGDGGSVSYETYRRAIGEIKSLKSKLNELLSEKEQQEAARLAEQGKWKERAELLEKQLQEKEQRFQSAVSQFAKRIFTESAKQAALRSGVRKEALDDVLKVADFSDVEVKEDFTFDESLLETKFRELAKSKPWFFEKPRPQVTPILPSTSDAGTSSTKPLEALSWDELKQLAKQVTD